MISIRSSNYQSGLYLLIVLFGLQNFFLGSRNFEFSFYEQIVKCFFWLSVLTVLGSVVPLIAQSIAIFRKKGVGRVEVFYLVFHIVLYYLVIWTSLYLSTQIR